MPIGLLQSEAYKFDSDFLSQLPFVEKAMLSRNIDPSAFTIEKSPAQSQGRYELTSQRYDYTVTIGEQSFAVTYPCDQSFLEFFLARCIAGESQNAPTSVRLGRERRNTKSGSAYVIKHSAPGSTDGQLSSNGR
jgi:hypothetical protein